MSDLQDALREYDQKGRGLNVLPASSPAMAAIVEAARLVADPNTQQWVDEVVLALDAATKIGRRSCSWSDHLHYANHDRLIASAPNFAGLTPGDTDDTDFGKAYDEARDERAYQEFVAGIKYLHVV